MPTFRCDYDISGDLATPSEVAELVIEASSGASITLKNKAKDENGVATGLHAIVIGNVSSEESAETELSVTLAEQLDLLTFVTHSRFKIISPIRLVEWEQNKVQRSFRFFHTFDSRYPPDHELIQGYIDTVQELDASPPSAFTRIALKYFRLGLIETQLEEQFMRLWLSLEIIAENITAKESTPFVCYQCKSNLQCKCCGSEQTRPPLAKQAINDLISKIVGVGAEEVSKRQFKCRNSLMHGGSSKGIEAETKMPFSEIIDELGKLTWHAIMSTIPLKEDGNPLMFGHRDGEFTSKNYVVSVIGTFEHTSDSPHPAEDKIPSGEISVTTSFREPTIN